jgi:hypothetical protein
MMLCDFINYVDEGLCLDKDVLRLYDDSVLDVMTSWKYFMMTCMNMW